MALTDRLQLLWSCVGALRGFFKVRFATRDIEKPRFLCLIASDLAYTFITSIKLLTLRLPGWNRRHIVGELALGRTIDLQIEDLSALVTRRKSGLLSGDKSVVDPLERLLRLLKNAKEFISTQLYRGEMKTETTNDAFDMAMVGALEDDLWVELMNDSAWNPSEFMVMDMPAPA